MSRVSRTSNIPPDGVLSRPLASVDDMTGAGSADAAAVDQVTQNAASSPPVVDWPALIAEAGLDVDEIAFLTANRVQNVPQREVAAALGWAPAKAARIRKRIDRRLANIRQEPRHRPIPKTDDDPPRGNSLHPAYLQHLPSGYRVWSLNPSHQTMCPQLPLYRGPISRISKGTPIMKVLPSDALNAERLKLAPLMTARETAEDRVTTLSIELAGKQAAATAANGSTKDMIAFAVLKVERLLTQAHQELKAADSAVAEQQQIVDDLQERIILTKRKIEVDRHVKVFANLLALCSAFQEGVGKAVADLKLTNAELSRLNAAVIDWGDLPGWDFGKRQILNNANGAYEDAQMNAAAAKQAAA